MKTEIIKKQCDFCKRIVFYSENGKKEDFLENILVKATLTNSKEETEEGEFCSLPCFLTMWHKIRIAEPTDIDLVKSLKEALPEWIIESPNYKEKYSKKVVKEAEEILKKIGDYKVIKD